MVVVVLVGVSSRVADLLGMHRPSLTQMLRELGIREGEGLAYVGFGGFVTACA